MFGVLKEIKPTEPDEWQQVVEKHREKFAGREMESIRRKFASFHRKQIAIGNPTCPWYVKEAKAIKYLIGRKAGLVDGEDVFNIETGEFTSTTACATNPTQQSDGVPPVGQSSQVTVGESDTAAPTAPVQAAPLLTHPPNPSPTEGPSITTFAGGQRGRDPRDILQVLKDCVELQSQALAQQNRFHVQAMKEASDDRKMMVEELRTDRKMFLKELRADRKIFVEALRVCARGPAESYGSKRKKKKRKRRQEAEIGSGNVGSTE